MNQGIIQVYTGDGKGKTTAAIGQALRSWGRGLKIIFYQWLKPSGVSGEQIAMAALDPVIPVYHLGPSGFIINRAPTPDEVKRAREDWSRVRKAIFSGDYDLIVIDELSHAINTGLVQVEEIRETLLNKPMSVELVLTGRAMPEEIVAVADLVTEMKQVKHPYLNGLPAREGIEY
ncbi:MAG TPA: cob(I)yrinic acid a,c-diamide adenosyltransferase [Bacillota bacterium]|nr:cob(I)yrinic acid a,c-diamide adenosyltransferase [Bacillota bacterium]